MSNKVLILDFGSQLTQLIARRIRELNIFSEIRPYHIPMAEIKAFGATAIILSGGPASVTEGDSPTISKEIFDLGIPILGICYGKQLMCQLLGGLVQVSGEREFGRAFIDIKTSSPFFKGLTGQKQVWMSHGDKATKLPDGFVTLASTDTTPYAAIANEAKKFYGVQFHPEVAHTPDGLAMLRNFLVDIAGIKATWTMDSFLENAIAEVRKTVGNKRVICAVSGGVDSSVVAALLYKALGDQVTNIFVDTGLLRKDEAAQVQAMFRDDFHVPLHTVSAGPMYYERLKDVSDPETKRKIIGKTFIDIFEEEAKRIGDAEFLAQGTLYPDVVESVSAFGGPSAVIKSHHNVGGLPERMNMKLVEPVRLLFKDEVRILGKLLGMPENMVGRHPFPGPGLGIRIPGDITPEKVTILQNVDAIYIEEIRKAGLYSKIWQAFAVLLPVRSVGVMGDGRTYDYVVSLRAVTSTDGMTADFFHFDYDFLAKVSNRITNEVRGVNRILYDVTSKPPSTIEWE
jgi:GMP synthase (glutamine-hydrolysing)